LPHHWDRISRETVLSCADPSRQLQKPILAPPGLTRLRKTAIFCVHNFRTMCCLIIAMTSSNLFIRKAKCYLVFILAVLSVSVFLSNTEPALQLICK
jgi:K+-sensing histidine kinase KdpD